MFNSVNTKQNLIFYQAALFSFLALSVSNYSASPLLFFFLLLHKFCFSIQQISSLQYALLNPGRIYFLPIPFELFNNSLLTFAVNVLGCTYVLTSTNYYKLDTLIHPPAHATTMALLAPSKNSSCTLRVPMFLI